MTSHPRHPADLDRALRGLLEPEARRAPMPERVRDVPSAWVRPPGRWNRAGRGLALVATSLLAATLVGLVLRQPNASTPRGSRVADPAAAMAFFGVDKRLALVTDDGIMAVRTGEGDPASIAVALISQTADGYAWRTLATTSTPTGPVVRSRVEVKTLSCNSGAGLAQPDLVFGFIRVPDGHLLLDVRPMAGTDQVRGTWDVTAFGTRHAGFFIYALRPGYQPPADGFELLVIDQHDVSRPDASTVPVAQERLPVSVPASSFTHDDQCNGESLDQ